MAPTKTKATPKTVRVICLTHSYYVDPRPLNDGRMEDQLQFHEHEVPHPDPTPQERELGATVILGVAEVPEDLYEDYYATHPSFALLDEFLGEHEGEADPVEETPDEDEDEDGDEGEETEEAGETGEAEGEGGGDEGQGSPNPLAGVNFASDRSGELAAELGLSAEDMGKVRPTGQGAAYTVPDIRKASKKRASATD